MQKEILPLRGLLLIPFLAVASVNLALQPCRAQEEAAKEAVKKNPVTTVDSTIPVAHLEVLLKPLTKEELVVEADGWRDLLKAKLTEIGQQQIAFHLQQEVGGDRTADAGAEDVEAARDQKKELVETLPKLKEEQALLTERMSVVVNALEKKGGDVEAYRQYIAAVSGVDIHATDAATAWTIFSGWFASEQGGQRWLWNIIQFLVILVAFYFAASILSGIVRRATSRIKDASQLLVDFLGKFVRQIVIIVGVIVALAALEVNIGPLLAAVGAAGFVVGFALQDTLSNFASGLMILAYRPFDVGDVIEAAGVSGSVDSVSLFSTHIRSFDNKVIIVPNNDIWGSTITNSTASDTRRVDMVFGIGYEDDVEKAKGIMDTLVQQHDLILDDPAPVVQMHELADSSINFVCRPWCKNEDYWTVYWDITRSVKEEFDRNGISIPFPQRDIHVYQETTAAAGSQVPEHRGQEG